MREFGYLLDMSASSGESVEDGMEVSSLLHRDDSKLIFFVNPHKEGLIVVVENTSAFWPFSVKSTSF